MTVGTIAVPVLTDADGITTQFSVPWTALEAGHIGVALQDPDGALTIPAFTVTGSGPNHWSISINPAPEAPLKVVRWRLTDPIQPRAFRDLMRLPAEKIEAAVNRLTLITQDLLARSNRTPMSPYGEDVDLVYPSASSRANKFFKWDDAGRPVADDARGPRGFVGPEGPRGIQGIQGIQGVQGPQGLAGVQAALNLLGVSPTTAGLPVSANNGDAWLTSDDEIIHIWFDGQWYDVLEYAAGVSETAVANTYYVAINGNDGNDGRALNRPKRTIEGGLAALAASGQPGVVSVYPGAYETDGEMVVPANSAVVAVGGQYVTNVISRPAHKTKNVFLLNSGSYIQGFTGRGQEVNDFDNPSGGFLAAFAPGATIMRSPYVRDVSQVSNYEANVVAAPLDPANANPQVGKGGGTLLADRAVLNQNSAFPYMLAFGATPRSPNGIGYVAKNGAGINGISAISIFSRIAFYSLNGGQITLNNAGTQFGDICFRSKGHTPVVQAEAAPPSALTTQTAAATTLEANRAAIINEMWADLAAAYPARADDAAYEEKTRRDAARLMLSIEMDLRGKTDMGARSFVKGLFDYKADYVFPSVMLPEFIFAFERLEFHARTFVAASAPRLMIAALFTVVKNTLNDPETVPFVSLVESQGHQFNNVGAGVNKNALPINFRRPGRNLPVPFSILEEANGAGQPIGRVSWNGSDEENTQYFAGGTTISGTTGRFQGRAFTAGVRQIARRITNSRGSY